MAIFNSYVSHYQRVHPNRSWFDSTPSFHGSNLHYVPIKYIEKSHVALLKINKINISASENQFKPPFHHWFAA